MDIKLTGLKEVPAQSRKGSNDWAKVNNFFAEVAQGEKAKKDSTKINPVQGVKCSDMKKLLGSGSKYNGVLRKAPEHCESIREITVGKELAYVTLNI